MHACHMGMPRAHNAQAVVCGLPGCRMLSFNEVNAVRELDRALLSGDLELGYKQIQAAMSEWECVVGVLCLPCVPGKPC